MNNKKRATTMQTELEQWKKDHVIYSADQKAAMILLEDLEAMLAGKVLCGPKKYECDACNGGGIHAGDRCYMCNGYGHLYAPASLTGNADIGKEGGNG
jgi:hypothetical protein